MSDRRVGDRRQPEPGVIKIKFQDAVWYIILIAIIIISVAANIVFAIKNNQYKQQINAFYNEENEDNTDYDDDLDYDSSEENDVEEKDVVENDVVDNNGLVENETNINTNTVNN